MIEIIPSINVNDFSELERKVRLVEPCVAWAHIDVSDGIFTKHVSWHNSKELVGFQTTLKLEVHLMIDKPEREIDQWAIVPAERLIVHYEATEDPIFLIDRIHKAQKEVGIAIKPDTPWLKLFPYFDKVELLQLLAVTPGLSGQKFQEEILHKLDHVRGMAPRAILEVDGGINTAVARRCVRHGANVLVAGSSIFTGENIGERIARLRAATTPEGFLSHIPGKTSAIV